MESSLILNIDFNPSHQEKHKDTQKKQSYENKINREERVCKKKINAAINEGVDEYNKLNGRLRAYPAQHISSLFAHNPDIPSLDSNEVLPVHEDVFSKDLFKNFSHLHPFMVKNLEDSFGVTKLTTVQKLALPVLLSGQDALVRSQTGSGKTLAYAVPIVEALHKRRPKLTRADGIIAVVVLPTRELALQTYECFVKLIKSFTWLVPGLVVGGEKRKSEKARLRKGINVLVGTPGRINDHAVHTEAARMDNVQWLVLDEADRLLDLGYEKEITSLVQMLETQGGGARRQTVLLSATLTAQVEKLAGLALNSPVRLDASNISEDELVIPQSLHQHYVVTPAKLRLVTLGAFIHWKCKMCREGKMLVFMATQDMVDYHTELLSTVLSGSAQMMRLHGNMSQHDRTQVFKTFKDAPAGVLFCTDVAARGLDLPSVDWIVQYTCPATASDYVHRVGRTARVGQSGSALLFVVPSEVEFITQLRDRRIRLEEQQMTQCIQKLKKIKWEDSSQSVLTVESAATELQMRLETAVVDQKYLHNLACKAYVSWVRFYATYPKETKECFNFKEIHLGHFAKSFALRDPPTTIGGLGKTTFKKEFPNKRKGHQQQLQTRPPPRMREEVSEFASGLPPSKKRKT